MGIVFRQSVKSSIAIATGALMGAAINFMYVFVFDKSELGLITNLLNQAVIGHVLVLMGVLSTLMTFLPRYEPDDPRRKVLLTICFLVPVLPIGVFSAVYLALKGWIVGVYTIADQPYIARYYLLLIPLVIGMSYLAMYEHYMVARIRVSVGSLMREVVVRLINIVSIVLYYFGVIDFSGFAILLAFGYFLPVLLMHLIAMRMEGFGFSLNLGVFSRSEYKELARFSWYHLLEGASFTLIGYVDSLMLAPLASDGMQSLSVYRNVIFIAMLVIMPLRALNASSFTVLNRAYSSGNLAELQGLFRRVHLNTFTVGLLLTGLIMLSLDNLVALMPPGYELLKPATLVFLLGRLFYMAGGAGTEMIGMSKYYRFNFYTALAMLVAVILLNRWLIPEWGILGASWSATITSVFFALLRMAYLWRKMFLPPFYIASVYVLVAVSVAGLTAWALPFIHHPVTDTLIRSALFVGVFLLIHLKISPSSDLSQYLKTIIREKRLF